MSERRGTKALELWCKRLVKDCPDVQIDNMTTSWRNGIAFCALVHHFRPDLIDMSSLKPENIYENNRLAFNIAEKHLGIPSLLDPEDMVENDVPDRLSILTYLSQFYQRLGHTVNTKATESESKQLSSPSSNTDSAAQIKFGKVCLDKCALCGLPVYLAQRLIVSQKLYHRRCFRCTKCLGHLNPKNFENVQGTDLICDSCKNENSTSKFVSDQMGMLAFSDADESKTEKRNETPDTPKQRPRPQSILDKINMFEKHVDTNVEDKLGNLSLKDNSYSKSKDLNKSHLVSINRRAQSEPVQDLNTTSISTKQPIDVKLSLGISSSLQNDSPEKIYKSNIEKFNFLQTQLTGDTVDDNGVSDNVNVVETNIDKDCAYKTLDNSENCNETIDSSNDVLKDDSNVTDDTRIAKSNSNSSNFDKSNCEETSEAIKDEPKILVPPRKKKNISAKKDAAARAKTSKEYPDHLNPFSDDEEQSNEAETAVSKVSTNPFGSDEEDDDVPPMHPPPKPAITLTSTPVKRLIPASNPFWSDGEEPTSDDESHSESTPQNTSHGALSRRGRTKAKAPAPPPPTVTISTSMDDVASISSEASFNTTCSDQKWFGRGTPRAKRRVAPTPPDSMSTVSGGGGSLEKGVDTSGIRSNLSDGGRRVKGPAPGLPLPERREVKLQMSPQELQVQLDLLETQQLGLERQGVLIEQMIRDKCEGDEAASVPQEEVEDLVIQLCELVNEKNDLFRKQTELMYIRRQQRLEQEQADIEHEIRVIQSRPTVNRIDADKAREEQLVSRLVAVVRARDELVQQIDAERRRERQEDLAIAASIATKRAQRSSESNSSSMKSMEVVTPPKKNKVKDKMKKQFKKAKHTLIPKKKEDTSDRKEEKDKKSKHNTTV